MGDIVTDYLAAVVDRGDEGSRLLHKICAPTLGNNSSDIRIFTTGIGGIAALRPPAAHDIVVYSCGGDPRITDLSEYVAFLVNRLCTQARTIGATPMMMANVIDSQTGDLNVLRTIAQVMVARANENFVSIVNGENAILGTRISGSANVSGTMVSIIPKGVHDRGVFEGKTGHYVVFDPGDDLVFVNSDGVGTKLEFYERLGVCDLAVLD